jgi:hypothetical protein
MSCTVRLGWRAFALATFALLCGLTIGSSPAQDKELKKLLWSHAFDLASRKFGEEKIDDKTQRFGVEAFLDDNTGLGLYISQVGSIALGPHFKGLKVPITPSKGPKWFTGLDLPTRKFGVKKFAKDTPVQCMEIFRDPNVDNWLYITDKGNIAATNGKLHPGETNKTPKWVHSVDLKVRKGNGDWDTANKYGIEVYYDGNSGNHIFATETGNVAIIPQNKDLEPDKGVAPTLLHGLDLKCRRHDEKAFSDTTRVFGVEVYHDTSTGNLVYVSETGHIALMTAPANLKVPAKKEDIKRPDWTHGLNVKCRKHREDKFSDETKAFGVEVFTDPNVGSTVYINELGAIAVMSAK